MKTYFNSLSEGMRSLLIGLVHSFLLLPVLFLFLRINELSGFESIVLFFAITQLTAAFFKKWWLYFVVQISVIFVFLYRSFPSLTVEASLTKWLFNLWQLGQQEWNQVISGSTSSVPLFLAILVLFVLATLLTFTTIHQKFAYPSFLIAFGYLMILHTFTSYAILSQAVTVIGFGVLLIGLTKLNQSQSNWYFFKLSTLTSLLTGALVGLAYWGVDWFMPSQEWVEMSTIGYQNRLESRGFFDWIDAQSPGSRYRQTGIGTNDEQLGGPLKKDYTRLFQAYLPEPSYWKVLHRWNYTGEGWSSSNTSQSEQAFSPYDRVPSFSSFGNDDGYYGETLETATINWQTPTNYIAQPYGWSTLRVEADYTQYSLTHGYYSDYFALESQNDAVEGYSIDYYTDYPDRSSEETLRGDDGWRTDFLESYLQYSEDTQIEDIMTVNEWMTNSFEIEELQLPTEFPQRVKDLAQELTEGMDSEYEMVRAIESYLKSEGGYRYSLRDTAQTPPGEDYVDHFLFDTGVGYCDNFSTAMVTMLRAVGIPARWVKGFTPGSSQTDTNGENYYQITNANAHSWPEVYFPSVGWVPFEPSPSFANPVTRTEDDVSPEDDRFSFDDQAVTLEDLETETDTTVDETTEEETLSEEVGEESIEDPVAEEASETEEAQSPDRSPFSIALFMLTISSLILFVFGTLYFSLHLRLVTWLLKKAILGDKISLEKACHWTLRLFDQKQKRLKSQTVPDYMNTFQPLTEEDTKTLSEFAALTDHTFYSKTNSDASISPLQKETLISTLDILARSLKRKH
ncbi:transglutaminase-like domain-containing protein [Marinilactibacillus sp. XAAS-LB27]|uniref:transglutaminase-like domain-containing protein n=1 Tax=Marinilactibacillus sp. XAAS-LB27 TaxID=3114538 RepID=UPI002E186C26|nr:transglutaminase-like domain-containing protein [Marinilactibacillus sp. XAAS-LB27]